MGHNGMKRERASYCNLNYASFAPPRLSGVPVVDNESELSLFEGNWQFQTDVYYTK